MNRQTLVAVTFLFVAIVARGQDVSRIAEVGLAPEDPTVLITGANRGIGLGFARHYAEQGWNVIATARNPDEAGALHELGRQFVHIVIEELDVLDADQRAFLSDKYTGVPIDLLINNAAFHGGDPGDHMLGNYEYSTFERYMSVNVFGPLAISEAFIESVAASEQKKLVTLTTGLASLTSPPPISCFQFQSISKAAANRAMRELQGELRSRGIIVALISPGRVDTDGLAAAGRACAPVASEQIAGLPEPLSVEASVAAMANVIADLDESYDGSHLDLHGNVVPW